jgi:CRP-like cAMP-binding protein
MRPRTYDDIPAAGMNKILALTNRTSRPYWMASLEPVQLAKDTILYDADERINYVYFLNNALVSILSTSSEGSTVEVSMIGYEGMVGVHAILGGVSPHRAVVQIGGDGFRIRGDQLNEEFRNNPLLHDLLLRYTNALLIQISQFSICNCYHSLDERLCRWLLVARDAVRGDVLMLTHEVIARLLGTRRASVTVAAGLLQRAGLIKISRGQLTILDPQGLQAASCECYDILRKGIRCLEVS